MTEREQGSDLKVEWHLDGPGEVGVVLDWRDRVVIAERGRNIGVIRVGETVEIMYDGNGYARTLLIKPWEFLVEAGMSQNENKWFDRVDYVEFDLAYMSAPKYFQRTGFASISSGREIKSDYEKSGFGVLRRLWMTDKQYGYVGIIRGGDGYEVMVGLTRMHRSRRFGVEELAGRVMGLKLDSRINVPIMFKLTSPFEDRRESDVSINSLKCLFSRKA